MATKKLTQWDKRVLEEELENLLKRLLIAVEEPPEFSGDTDSSHIAVDLLKSTIPTEDWDQLGRLDAKYSGAIRTSVMQRIRLKEYTVSFRAFAPNVSSANLMLSEQHPDFERLYRFCKEEHEMATMHAAANKVGRSIVHHCSSAGQIVRVAPFIKDFLPAKAAKSLEDAERMPRLPTKLAVSREELEQLHNALAISAVLPEWDWSKSHDCSVVFDPGPYKDYLLKRETPDPF